MNVTEMINAVEANEFTRKFGKAVGGDILYEYINACITIAALTGQTSCTLKLKDFNLNMYWLSDIASNLRDLGYATRTFSENQTIELQW